MDGNDRAGMSGELRMSDLVKRRATWADTPRRCVVFFTRQASKRRATCSDAVYRLLVRLMVVHSPSLELLGQCPRCRRSHGE